MNYMCVVNWNLILEFTKVFVSWPMLIGILGILSVFIFKKQIGNLIDRIDKAKFPGGSINTPQKENLELSEPNKIYADPKSEEIEPKIEKLELDAEQIEEIKKILEAEQAAARIWEYRYLNYFLATNSQFVLNWIISHSPVTFNIYDTAWMHLIPSAEERKAIIEALSKHHLINCSGSYITVTPKGVEYAKDWTERPIPYSTN